LTKKQRKLLIKQTSEYENKVKEMESNSAIESAAKDEKSDNPKKKEEDLNEPSSLVEDDSSKASEPLVVEVHKPEKK
jgi:hypothetical protein